MKVRFKKLHKKAQLPSYAHDGEDAGLDIRCVSKQYDDNNNVVYHTGLAVEIPKGYAGFMFPRSSNDKKQLSLSNCVGIVDSGYRGEFTFKYRQTFDTFKEINTESACFMIPFHDRNKEYEIGDKVGQMVIMPYPHIEPEWADDLSETERGDGGYGSTGK